jgi:hypothetical protein
MEGSNSPKRGLESLVHTPFFSLEVSRKPSTQTGREVGLMKPWKGFTPVGQEKPGGGQALSHPSLLQTALSWQQPGPKMR